MERPISGRALIAAVGRYPALYVTRAAEMGTTDMVDVEMTADRLQALRLATAA